MMILKKFRASIDKKAMNIKIFFKNFITGLLTDRILNFFLI